MGKIAVNRNKKMTHFSGFFAEKMAHFLGLFFGLQLSKKNPPFFWTIRTLNFEPYSAKTILHKNQIIQNRIAFQTIIFDNSENPRVMYNIYYHI